MERLRFRSTITMEEGGWWSTDKMLMNIERLRWSFAIIMDFEEDSEPILHSYLFLCMCLILVYLRELVSLLSRDKD